MPRIVERSDRGHRRLLLVLSALLIGFSVWCVDLWIEQARLRRQLDARLGWLGDLQRLEARLDGSAAADPFPDEGWSRRLERLGSRAPEDPLIQISARRLVDALRSLAQPAPETRDQRPDQELEDAAWAARISAREASGVLQAALLADLGSLHERLRSHWSAIGFLLVASLGLAASNLALLGLAHRRRRDLEIAHREAVQLASHDRLTGLWNREEILNHLRRELDRVRRSPTALGLVLADIDAFKKTNDFLGQDEGDRVLCQVADRYLARLRPYDHGGRFGGDSFLFVLPTCDRPATRSVAERLRAAMQEPFEHRHGSVDLTATFAWAALQGPRELDPDNVVRRLHLALEDARRSDPGGVPEEPGEI